MLKDYQAIADNVTDCADILLEGAEEHISRLIALAEGTKKDGVLDSKTKTLITLAIAISMRCDPCIAKQTLHLVEKGVSREEIAEVSSICLNMGGAPSITYAAGALEAYDQFTAAKNKL